MLYTYTINYQLLSIIYLTIATLNVELRIYVYKYMHSGFILNAKAIEIVLYFNGLLTKQFHKKDLLSQELSLVFLRSHIAEFCKYNRLHYSVSCDFKSCRYCKSVKKSVQTNKAKFNSTTI